MCTSRKELAVITIIRIVFCSTVMLAETFLPDANMIVLLGVTMIVATVLVDRQRDKIEVQIVSETACDMIKKIRSAVSKPGER